MPKRRYTCRVIKVSRNSTSRSQTQALIQDIIENTTSLSESNGTSAHDEPVEVEGVSLYKLSLQIINALFPNHCQGEKRENDLCETCRQSLDYNSSTFPCWYRSLNITGLLMKQAIVRLETEYAGDSNYRYMYLKMFLKMLDDFDESIDPRVLFDKPSASTELVDSLFQRLKNMDKGSLTVLQCISNSIVGNMLNIDEFSPAKTMSLELCHLIHLYTWKTVAVPGSISFSELMHPNNKPEIGQTVSLEEGQMKQEAARQIYDHFQNVKSSIFNYILLNPQQYFDVVQFQQYFESHISMFPSMYDFKSNRRDAWLECMLSNMDDVFKFFWLRGPETQHIHHKSEQSWHYSFDYPIDTNSMIDKSMPNTEFPHPVLPKIKDCIFNKDGTDMHCTVCKTKIGRGSNLYPWTLGTNVKNNFITGILFPREIPVLARKECEWDEKADMPKYSRTIGVACSRKCYIENERSKFPQLHKFLTYAQRLVPEIKESNTIIQNIQEDASHNKDADDIADRCKASNISYTAKIINQLQKIELDGLKDLVLLEYFSVQEEELLNNHSSGYTIGPEIAWKILFIPNCFRLTKKINSKILLACKKQQNQYISEEFFEKLGKLNDGKTNKLESEDCSMQEAPTRLSQQMCEGTNATVLISHFKKASFFENGCFTKGVAKKLQCKHQTAKTLTLVWKKEWSHLYSPFYTPALNDVNITLSIESCERLESLDMFCLDKEMQQHRLKCMKEVVSYFDLPFCCAFPINNSLIEIKDLKNGTPFLVTDDKQKQNIKKLMKSHDYLIFAQNLDLKHQRCVGGILFFDDGNDDKLCGKVMTGQYMFNFLMDYQKLLPFLNDFSIYERWGYDKSYLIEHELYLLSEIKEHNPLTSGKVVLIDNAVKTIGIGRHKFGALTLCLLKETFNQREKIHKQNELLKLDQNCLFSIPFRIIQSEVVDQGKETNCILENVVECFGNQELHKAISVHTTMWSHDPKCFFSCPWICAADKYDFCKENFDTIVKLKYLSNKKRNVECHKCTFGTKFTWEFNDSIIDHEVLIEDCPLEEEGNAKTLSVPQLKPIRAAILKGVNPLNGYLMYDDPCKVIMPGYFDLYMINYSINPNLISGNLTSDKPKGDIKVLATSDALLIDILYWALAKFNCKVKHDIESQLFFLLDTNDAKNQNMIHVPKNVSPRILSDLLGHPFDTPFTIFVQERNQKKKDAVMCNAEMWNYPYKSIISRQSFDDSHIVSTSHCLAWHGHAFALIQETLRNKSIKPQESHPLLDHHDKALRKYYAFCRQFDLFVAKCSYENYETTSCCQAVAEIEFFKCRNVLMLTLTKNVQKKMNGLVEAHMQKENRRGYCMTVGPSLDLERNKDMITEFLDSSLVNKNDTMIVVGSNDTKRTTSGKRFLHYGFLKYNAESGRLQLFVPSDMDWHKNVLEKYIDVEDCLVKINKNIVSKDDMYGVLYFPPELRSEQFVNFKVCHIARFRNEMKPRQEGLIMFLTMQKLDEMLRRNYPDLFGRINNFELFCIWPHLNYNTIKKKFKRYHELSGMLITHDDYMCDLIKMDNHIEACEDFRDGDVVIFTTYSMYDAFVDADPSSHIILTAKMGVNGIFHFKMLPPQHTAEVISILKDITKLFLNKFKGLGYKGQYTMESVFEKIKSRENALPHIPKQQIKLPLMPLVKQLVDEKIKTTKGTADKISSVIDKISTGDTSSIDVDDDGWISTGNFQFRIKNVIRMPDELAERFENMKKKSGTYEGGEGFSEAIEESKEIVKGENAKIRIGNLEDIKKNNAQALEENDDIAQILENIENLKKKNATRKEDEPAPPTEDSVELKKEDSVKKKVGKTENIKKQKATGEENDELTNLFENIKKKSATCKENELAAAIENTIELTKAENMKKKVRKPEDIKKKNATCEDNDAVLKQKLQLKKQVGQLKVESEHLPMNPLSIQNEHLCSNCDKRLPSDDITTTLLCIKCKKSFFCDDKCLAKGMQKHEMECEKFQEEYNINIIEGLNL